MIDWHVFPGVKQVAHLPWSNDCYFVIGLKKSQSSEYRLQECSGTVSAILEKVE